MNNINRREFLKIMGKSSMAIALSAYLVPSKLSASDGSEFDDFKALVVVKMGGGNDGLSMFVPADTTQNITTGYEKYAKARSDELRIKNIDMMADLRAKRGEDNCLNFGGGGSNNLYSADSLNESYTKGFYLQNNYFDSKIATNSLMPELANLLDLGKGAVIQNVGSIKSLYTKAELKEDPSRIPPFQGSHGEGSIFATSGQATSVYSKTGWLGRLADAWPNLEKGSVHGMNINLSKFGTNKMMQGNTTSAINIGYKGPLNFKLIDKAKYRDVFSVSRGDKFEKLFISSRKSAYTSLDTLLTDWNYVIDNDPFSDELDSYGNELLADVIDEQVDLENGVDGYVIKNFSTAARLIYNAKRNGDKRIVICVSAGGYDTHSGQVESHTKSYRGLSIALDKFTKAMEKLDLLDNVTTFNMSEFGRTTVSNGNGTDHGWGGSHFVLGGAVKPGNYGIFPDLTPNSDDDIARRGRLIPSTSYTQHYATIARWFGANDDVLHAVFPELGNFTNEDGSFTDVGFMKSTNIV